jgi:molecular chaperone GrpE
MTDRHAKRQQAEARRQADAQHDEAVDQPTAEAADESAGPAGSPPAAESPDDTLTAVAAERDDYLGHLQRLQAEFDNYRKRVRRDQEDLRLRAAETVVESMLPVVDNMGRALEAARQHGEGQMSAGVELVYEQLLRTLAGHGLTEVEVEPGAPFDPEVHEAVMTQASDDHDEGAVLQVMERGYLLHGRLLRPAKVIVVR